MPTSIWNIQAIRMAQRIPSRHSVAMLESSQSCNPTLKAARNGVQAVCHQIERIMLQLFWCTYTKYYNINHKTNGVVLHTFQLYHYEKFDISFFKYFFTSVGNSQVCFILTLNIGRTCSKWVALVKFDWTWLTLSIKALAVVAMCSISTL